MSHEPKILKELEALPSHHMPDIRGVYKTLERGHKCVDRLLGAVAIIDELRRSKNENKSGRASEVEVDILRSAIVMTSSCLDATMQALITNIAPKLILAADNEARKNYRKFLNGALSKTGAQNEVTKVIIKQDPHDDLISIYVKNLAKGSFQGSGDLKERIYEALGLPQDLFNPELFTDLDPFFAKRNRIVHQMDLSTESADKRNHHSFGDVKEQCDGIFAVANQLIRATIKICNEHGIWRKNRVSKR